MVHGRRRRRLVNHQHRSPACVLHEVERLEAEHGPYQLTLTSRSLTGRQTCETLVNATRLNGIRQGWPARTAQFPLDGRRRRREWSVWIPMDVRLTPFWYVACLSDDLRGKRPVARTVLGVRMALFRDEDGRAAAVVDRCPHRNTPLSIGKVCEGQLQCAYHGWRFDGSGACRAVPGLVGEEPDRRSRRVETFRTIEQDGFVWVLPVAVGTPDAANATSASATATATATVTLPARPIRFPHVDDPGYTTVRRSLSVTAGLHAALENTLDVPHTAFLHGGLFRGVRPPVDIEVVVRHTADGVEAEYLGEPRPPGIAGRILAPEGGIVTHVDRFRMPSIAQVEYRLGENHLVTTTAFTPAEEGVTDLHAAVTFHLRLPPRLVKAVVTPVANRIFAQDQTILREQAANIRRFGGERYASTDLDVLGMHILRLLRRAERGEASDGANGGRPADRRFTMRV
jgi:phenylpropionate dioxygenase-like ring-hydroxylating dioxygenase large terminal subunit